MPVLQTVRQLQSVHYTGQFTETILASDNCGVLEGEEYADLQRVLSVKEVPQPEMHHAARSKARFGGRRLGRNGTPHQYGSKTAKAPSWASARLL